MFVPPKTDGLLLGIKKETAGMETIETANIKNDLLGDVTLTHTDTVTRLLSLGEVGVNAFTLYSFYCYVSSIQNTNQVKATDLFCMRGLHWGKERFFKAKALLISENIIKPIRKTDPDGKVSGWYIRISYIVRTTSTQNQTVVQPEGGFQPSNALYINNINALDINNNKNKNSILEQIKSNTESNKTSSLEENAGNQKQAGSNQKLTPSQIKNLWAIANEISAKYSPMKGSANVRK